MKIQPHRTAKPSHYNKEAASYDAFNENNSKQMNQLIEGFFKQYGAHTVLDLTCGTGSQVFWLTKKGYEVVGVDINEPMLKIAKSKVKKEQSLKFIKGDMRSTHLGQFDAVITMFNSIGHLSYDTYLEQRGSDTKISRCSQTLQVYAANQLTTMLQGNGFKVLNQCSVDGSKFAEMDFQVPGFYQKLGYTIDFSRKGYNKGATCIFMSKKL